MDWLVQTEWIGLFNTLWGFLENMLKLMGALGIFSFFYNRDKDVRDKNTSVFNKLHNFDNESEERIRKIENLFEAPRERPGPGSEPSRFLLEEFQIVDFRGREEELEKLDDWACLTTSLDRNMSNVSIAFLTGPQGRGKSRLARELCERIKKRDWNGETWSAGFLKMEVNEDNFPLPMEWREPVLLVIDQAERRVEQVKKIISAAFGRQGDHPVRVLLVARSKDEEWWSRLKGWDCEKRSVSGSGKVRVSPFEKRKIIEVEIAAIENDKELKDRRQEFDRALKAFEEDEAFKEFLKQSKIRNADEAHKNKILNDLLRAKKVDLLDIHVAALLVARGGDADNVKELFQSLVDCEAKGWYEAIEAAGLTKRELKEKQIRHAFAWLATTDKLINENDAIARLSLLPDFDERFQEKWKVVVGIAAELYPGSGAKWWGGIAPDRLTTWLTHELDIIIEKYPKAVADLPKDALVNLLRHLTWRVQLYGSEHEQVLQSAIRAGGEKGIFAAVKVGAEIGKPVSEIAPRALREMEGAKDVEIIKIARDVDDYIDVETVSLKELAYAATEILYRNAPSDKRERAKRAHRLSLRLSGCDKPDEAVVKSKEAVALRSELVDWSYQSRSDLADSLNNLSIFQSELGRYKEALDAIEKCETIHDELVREGFDKNSSSKFRSDRAIDLLNSGEYLFQLGRSGEAFQAAKETEKIYRELARKDKLKQESGVKEDEKMNHGLAGGPFEEDIRSGLAASLNNQSVYLFDLGEREEALQAAEAAEKEYRKLAEVQPDKFRHDLAESLHNLSVGLSGLGQRKKALDVIKEAESIRRELAEARSGVFRSDLALSLNHLSNRLSDLGEREEALKAVEEAVLIHRERAEARPGKFRPDLARSLNDRGNCLFALGRREEALKDIGEAVSIRCRLAADLPQKFLPDLARSLNDQSAFLSACGASGRGLKVIARAVKIRRELVANLPKKFLPDLAISLQNQSARLSDLGRDGALEIIEEAVVICRELAENWPDAFRPYLAASLHHQGNRLSDLGRHGEAFRVIEEAVALYRALVTLYRTLVEEDRPVVFRSHLAASLHDLSDCLSSLERNDDALKAVEEAVSIRSELAEAWAEKFRPDLARSLNHLNVALSALGRHDPQELEAIDKAVDIYHELAEKLPNVFRPSLAASLHNQSISLLAFERYGPAFWVAERAVAIYHELENAQPGHFRAALELSLENLRASKKACQEVKRQDDLAWTIVKGIIWFAPRHILYSLLGRRGSD